MDFSLRLRGFQRLSGKKHLTRKTCVQLSPGIQVGYPSGRVLPGLNLLRCVAVSEAL